MAQRIRDADPDHVVHLGDIYYSGTPREVRKYFLDVWRDHGPSRARYWTLNGNHDMYGGGRGYFEHALPAIGQPASYFALGNARWQLIALDSAYVHHNFTRPQVDWLHARTRRPGRSILLTHHHLVSPFRKPGYRLGDWLEPFFAEGSLYGWFWGHDHHLVDYGTIRGVRCRCIGHGGVPRPIPPERFRHEVRVERIDRRPSASDSRRGMNGFALLAFDGPAQYIDYVDQTGGTAWSERWD